MLLNILTKSSILDVWLGSKNTTKSFNKSFCKFNFFIFSIHLVKHFFLVLCNFYFFQCSKTIFKFCWTKFLCLFKQIFTWKHTQVFKFLVVIKTKQWCLMISNEIFIILIWRKWNLFNFFILKWERIESLFFCKIHGHFKMIILKWLCIFALLKGEIIFVIMQIFHIFGKARL